MFIAHFEIKKEEPKKIYFNASNYETKSMEFSVKKRNPIVFKISSDLKNVEVRK